MRTGQAVHIWGPRPIAEVLMEIRATGDEGAEIFAHHLTGPMATPDGLRQSFDEAGVRLAGVYVDVSPRSRDEVGSSVRGLLELLPFLQAAGADRLIVGPGVRTVGGPTLEQLDLIIEALNMLGRQAREAGVAACFHQHVGGQVETPAEFEMLVAGTDPDSVFMCLDTGHLAKAGIDPLATAEKYAVRIGQVHLKDIRDGAFVQLGEGTLDNRPILEYLWRAGYRGWVIPEIPTKDPKPAALTNHRYVRSIVDALR